MKYFFYFLILFFIGCSHNMKYSYLIDFYITDDNNFIEQNYLNEKGKEGYKLFYIDSKKLETCKINKLIFIKEEKP